LDTLSKLNPDKEGPYFYNALSNQDFAELETDNLDHKSVEEWMGIVKEIDMTARIWIEYALDQAANNAKNERTKQWIENAINVSDNADASIINIILDNNHSFEDYDKEDFSKQYDMERLKKRIAQLQKFSQLNENLLSSYKTKLEKYLKT
jgi:hypothetical protein